MREFDINAPDGWVSLGDEDNLDYPVNEQVYVREFDDNDTYALALEIKKLTDTDAAFCLLTFAKIKPDHDDPLLRYSLLGGRAKQYSRTFEVGEANALYDSYEDAKHDAALEAMDLMNRIEAQGPTNQYRREAADAAQHA
jgi:hypothetical protein